MKQKNQWILLLIAAAGVLGCVWAWFADLQMLLFWPSIPTFCIQLFLCRSGWKKRLWALPLVFVLLYALAGIAILLFSSGWDGLLGIIMLLTSISPAVGCLAGLMIHRLILWRQK